MRMLKIEKKTYTSTKSILFGSLVALLMGFGIASLIFWAYGVNLLYAYQKILKGSFGSGFAVSETIRRAIPLLLCGVGLSLAFRASFWNIGAEGQILAGAIAATWVALFSGIPEPLLIPAMFFFGFLAGVVWGFIPTFLKSKWQVNEIITTLMLNFIAASIVLYLIHGPWRGEEKRGFAYTNTFPQVAWLKMIGTTRVPWLTLILGLVAATLVYILVWKTTWGYEIRVIGENPDAGRFAGMSHFKVVLLVMFISGGLAGIAGVGEIAGIHHLLRNPEHISLGYGFTAIIVAWLARSNPLAVILTSLFFGAMFSGGDTIKVSLGIPFQAIYAINGIILSLLIASIVFTDYKISIRR